MPLKISTGEVCCASHYLLPDCIKSFMRSSLRRHEPSVCLSVVCLPSVTLLRPTHTTEVLGNIFAPCNSLGTRSVGVLKVMKKSRGFWVIAQVKRNCGKKNWRFSTNIWLYFENGTRYDHSNNERQVGVICDLSNSAISNEVE